MSTLCSKDVCTTAHILEVCKVSLLQRRYTFRHDTVLHQVIKAIVGGYSEKLVHFCKSMKLGRVTISHISKNLEWEPAPIDSQ